MQTDSQQTEGAGAVRSGDLFSDSPTWPYVLEFAKRMESKLARNRHKGDREGWINDEPDALLARLHEETRELENELAIAVVRMHEPLNASMMANRVADEAADVANFAMMIADWHKARTQESENSVLGQPSADKQV